MLPTMTVQILTHQLSYVSREDVQSVNPIFNPVEVLKLPDGPIDMSVHPLVYDLLKEGTLVIKSSVSSKSIFAGVRYVIAKPVDTGLALQYYFVESLADVKAKLQEGWKICKQSANLGLVDMLVPNDSEYLSETIDLSMRWREAVAAVINQEIQANCNWSVGRAFTAAITAAVKDIEIVVPSDCTLLEPGESMMAHEYVCAYVLRALETQLAAVFEFIKDDRNALYLVQPTRAGVVVNKYADVRALLWYRQAEQERILREQAIEDGLGSGS